MSTPLSSSDFFRSIPFTEHVGKALFRDGNFYIEKDSRLLKVTHLKIQRTEKTFDHLKSKNFDALTADKQIRADRTTNGVSISKASPKYS